MLHDHILNILRSFIFLKVQYILWAFTHIFYRYITKSYPINPDPGGMGKSFFFFGLRIFAIIIVKSDTLLFTDFKLLETIKLLFIS